MNNEENHTTHPQVKIALRILGTTILGGIIFLGGVYVGYDNKPAFAKVSNVVHQTDAATTQTDFSPFWKAWQLVSQNFAPATTAKGITTDQNKVYGAIKGMVASFGDPYTTFFTPSENTQFQAQIAGSFSGVGIDLGQKDGILTVISPLKGTPAEKAGIKPGDQIIKIDSAVTANLAVDQAVALIQGKSGTTVTLTLVRAGEAAPLVVPLVRQTIELPTVDTALQPNGVFVIHFYTFSANSAGLFRAAMDKYLASRDHKLLLDLRGNPGGYLDSAVQIASEFIPAGETVVKEIGKDPKDVTVHASTGPVIFPQGDKLMILADQGSASAAEILAGALSEQGIGELVGQQTYGKGSVQQVVPLTSDTSLKITIAHWYTPNGISISLKGLTPHVLIPFDAKATTDTQLQKAVDLLAAQ